MTRLGRRRLLAVTAATAACWLAPAAAREIPARLSWRGSALGAEVTITIAAHDALAARDALRTAIEEIYRLEAAFSLYRPDSELVTLNRRGRLETPSPDMLQLLGLCRRLYRATDGRFDPSVQPLYALYARHFAARDADPAGPDAAAIERARRAVGFDAVIVAPHAVSFARDGMALTLNGIAQGYIADRVRERLRVAGIAHALVNLGEFAALGPRETGTPWRIRLGDGPSVPLDGTALAVSAPAATRLSATVNHIFDPHTGRSAPAGREVAVLADRAAVADGLSTALCLFPEEGIGAALGAGATQVFLRSDGGIWRQA